jgi:hypothetical protein
MNPGPVFAVVGIRPNGSRLVIADQQSQTEAAAIRTRVSQAGAFTEIVIEPVELEGGHDTVDGEFGTIEMGDG